MPSLERVSVPPLERGGASWSVPPQERGSAPQLERGGVPQLGVERPVEEEVGQVTQEHRK